MPNTSRNLSRYSRRFKPAVWALHNLHTPGSQHLPAHASLARILYVTATEMSALEVHIHQGRYDALQELINLRNNAITRGRSDILDAIHQRLRKVHPKVYQRLVGPLRERKRDPRFECYCNHPSSLETAVREILAAAVHPHCLTCDACWQEDICAAWGYYGWAAKVIPQATWDTLCEERSSFKFVE